MLQPITCAPDLSVRARGSECWLRELPDKNSPTFGQRGKYSMRYRTKMLRTRKTCVDINTPGGLSPGWACPPTHVPWTSGSPGTKADVSVKWQTGGGWGNMRIHRLGADGLTPIEESCTRNGGSPCDNMKLDHGRRLDLEQDQEGDAEEQAV